MRPPKQNSTLDPDAKRELEALDAALAGEPVDPEFAGLAELSAELRELRPSPSERFSADLDARSAAGFPRRRRAASEQRRQSALGRLSEKLRATPPRRILASAGAAALTCVVVATAVVATGGGNLDDSGTTALGGEAVDVQLESGGGAGSSGEAPQPLTGDEQARLNDLTSGDDATQLRSLEVVPESRSSERLQATLAGGGLPGEISSPGPFASGERRRFAERSANLTLGTEPEQVRDVTDEVFGVVGRYEGIVLSSSIRDGIEGEAGARFDLRIPSAKLSDALADLSAIAEVRSREEASEDITAPVVTVQERLQDARAEVQGLLKQLANADTDEKRAAVEQQLAFQRSRVAQLRSSLSALERRANLSSVSVQIVTGDAESFGPTENDGQWGIADAVDDAGKILGTAAGVTLVSLAVLAPFALILMLAWLARRTWVRQSRERALEV